MSGEREIWIKSTAIFAGYVGSIVLLQIYFSLRGWWTGVQGAVIAFSIIQAVTTFGLMGRSLWNKYQDQLQAERRRYFEPALRRVLGRHAAGEPPSSEVRKLFQSRPEDSERVFAEYLVTMRGASLQRVQEAARDAGVVHRWHILSHSSDRNTRLRAIEGLMLVRSVGSRRALIRALDDDDPYIGIIAARALLRLDKAEGAEAVFRFALRGAPISRSLLSTELARHAERLGAECLPGILRHADALTASRALDLVASWRMTLTFDGLKEAIERPEKKVRAAALRAVRWAQDRHELEPAVGAALVDRDPEVQAAAIEAAGRLRMVKSIHRMARHIRSAEPAVAKASAEALASFGYIGRRVLEIRAREGGTSGAVAALEALTEERLRKPIGAGR